MSLSAPIAADAALGVSTERGQSLSNGCRSLSKAVVQDVFGSEMPRQIVVALRA